jgi:cytochrome c oxidase subunit 4
MSAHEHHISTDKLLLGIGGALLILTIATVGVHYLALPHPWSIIVAMFIALIKASLVALFFMNLYWDAKLNGMLLIASVVFLGLLVGFTMLDTLFRVIPVPSF